MRIGPQPVWIRVEANIFDKPEIMATETTLKINRREAVGLWVDWFLYINSKTYDGFIPGLTPAMVDERIGLKGFAQLGVEIGWMEFAPGGLNIPNFSRYNGPFVRLRSRQVAQSCRHYHRRLGRG